MAPGEYRLRVRVTGLSNWEADHVMVGLGTATHLNPILTPLAVHRTVLVDGQAVKDRASDSAATVIAGDVPNNSHHWSRIAALIHRWSRGCGRWGEL